MIMTTSNKNLKRVTFLNQSGPKIEQNRVMVYKGGNVLRISGDLIRLMIGSKTSDDGVPLIPFVDSKKKQLVLKYDTGAQTGQVLRTWKSSPKSKSVLVSIAGLLRVLGITEEEAPGTYPAKVAGKAIYIDF